MSLTFTLKKALKTGDSSGERIRTTNHRVNRLPRKWVAEEQLIALKGIKKGTLKRHEKTRSWREESTSMWHSMENLGITARAFITLTKLIDGLNDSPLLGPGDIDKSPKS